MMKILQITAYYPPSLGGIQTFVQRLSQYLAERGHQVDVLTVNTDHAPAQEAGTSGIRITRTPLDLNLYRAVFSRSFAQKLMSASGYDVYHIHIPFHVGLETAVLAARRNRTPLVATHHGQGLRGSPLYTMMAHTYSWFSQNISLRGVDVPVFLTPSYAHSLNLPAVVQQRMQIVRTGAEVQQFSAGGMGTAIRQTYNIPASDPLILFVGYLGKSNRYKGIDYLLKAFVSVRQQSANARLLIVGGGDWLPELQTLAERLEIADRVIFAGPVENGRLPDYYAAADLFVLPSISGPENSPVVLFEAMASAKPVVATTIPGVVDIVKHEETGLLVPPKDVPQLAAAITRIVQDKDFRQRAGRYARQHTEQYTWKHCAQQMEQIYQARAMNKPMVGTLS